MPAVWWTLTGGGGSDVGAADGGDVADSGVRGVVQQDERGGAADVGAFKRGQCDADDGGAEGVLGHRFGVGDAGEPPTAAREALELAHLV